METWGSPHLLQARQQCPVPGPGVENVGQGALTQVPSTGSGTFLVLLSPVSLEGAVGRGACALAPCSQRCDFHIWLGLMCSPW